MKGAALLLIALPALNALPVEEEGRGPIKDILCSFAKIPILCSREEIQQDIQTLEDRLYQLYDLESRAALAAGEEESRNNRKEEEGRGPIKDILCGVVKIPILCSREEIQQDIITLEDRLYQLYVLESRYTLAAGEEESRSGEAAEEEIQQGIQTLEERQEEGRGPIRDILCKFVKIPILCDLFNKEEIQQDIQTLEERLSELYNLESRAALAAGMEESRSGEAAEEEIQQQIQTLEERLSELYNLESRFGRWGGGASASAAAAAAGSGWGGSAAASAAASAGTGWGRK